MNGPENEPDDQDIIQWQDSLRWLDRAAADIRVVRLLLREDIVPQAAEVREALPAVEALFSTAIANAPTALAGDARVVSCRAS